MRDLSSWWMLLAVLAFGGISAVVGWYAAKKRREAMQRFAASRGWTYVTTDPGLVTRFDGAPFGRGFGRRAFNAIHGQHDGRPFVSFDYLYKTRSGSGKNRRTTTHRYSVLALSLGVRVPDLAVRPQSFVDKVVDVVVDNDIELESEEFNRTFTVTSPDRKFASDVLHPRLMEHLLRFPAMGWKTQGDSIVAVEHGQRSLGQIDATLVLLDGITDQVPEFVWEQLRGSR